MNDVIAGIYGTGGAEKVAAAGSGEKIERLDQLALLIGVEAGLPFDEANIEKTASAVHDIWQDLVNYDRSGRAMAHHEFSQMEAEAAAGDTTALEAFFASVEQQPQQQKTASLKERIQAELLRRTNGG